MNDLTIEWVQKAEGDYETTLRESRVRRNPNYDAVCFHAQQTAEKYLKAVLQESGSPFPKTHNLIELLEMCLRVDPTFEMMRRPLVLLDRYAIRYRYPGESAEKDEGQAAVQAVKVVREIARSRLGLPFMTRA
jgi:HEPN domain-containing protein